MLSAMVLERPGKWRLAVIVLGFLVVLLPALPLLPGGWISTAGGEAVLTRAFGVALGNSALVAILGLQTGFSSSFLSVFVVGENRIGVENRRVTTSL